MVFEKSENFKSEKDQIRKIRSNSELAKHSPEQTPRLTAVTLAADPRNVVILQVGVDGDQMTTLAFVASRFLAEDCRIFVGHALLVVRAVAMGPIRGATDDRRQHELVVCAISSA